MILEICRVGQLSLYFLTNSLSNIGIAIYFLPEADQATANKFQETTNFVFFILRNPWNEGEKEFFEHLVP